MNKRFDIILCSVFFSIIFLPGILWVLSQEDKELNTPEFQLSAFQTFPTAFDKFFRKNFHGRNCYYETANTVKKTLFNSLSTPHLILGKQEFLFFNREEFRSDFLHKNLLDKYDITHLMLQAKSNHAKLKKSDIIYLKGYLPDTHEIYPENLPSRIRFGRLDTTSRFDQFYGAMKSISALLVNVKPAILQKKDRYLLYFKNDTHWNELGAYIAYKEIMEKLAAQANDFRPLPMSHFSIDWYSSKSSLDSIQNNFYSFHPKTGTYFNPSGLSNAIGRGTEIVDSIPVFDLNDKPNIIRTRHKLTNINYINITLKNSNALTNKSLIVFGDSFSEPMLKFFSLHFKKIDFYRSEVNWNKIDLKKTDVVLDLKVGRKLNDY